MKKMIEIHRLSLSERIAFELRRMILSGELKPGQPITENSLLEMFDVSRTPLREALQKLHGEHLIDISSTRRMSIAKPCRDDIRDRLFVLQHLEACAVKLTTTNATDSDIENLRGLQQKMAECANGGENVQYFEHNIDFHRAIVEISRNDFLIETHKEYNNALYRHRFLSSNHINKNREMAMVGHDKIIDAIADGNVAQAEKAVYDHFRETHTNLETYWQQNPENNA